MSGVIVHEWIAETGGAEKVLDEFCLSYPDAAVVTLWNDDRDRDLGRIHESWLSRTPLRRHKALALPLMPATWRHLRVAGEPYEWALVSSHLFAHHIRFDGPSRGIPKYVYVHTPARYIWEPTLDPRGNTPVARLAGLGLRPLDRKRAAEATSMVANSQFTRERVQRAWDRDAEVIYPPVDSLGIIAGTPWIENVDHREAAVLSRLRNPFVLGASRLVGYKRLELVIRAGEAAELPVVIVGAGPDRARLDAVADSATVPVSFVGRVSTPMLRALFEAALVFVFPAIEDFGIMPVEAMAAGTPVIVPAIGGAAESVALLGGGVAVEDFSKSALRTAIVHVAGTDRAVLRQRSTALSRERFRTEIESWVRSSN